ncbi:MAG: HDOD domain-containing protein [Gammaproteobacteria bacterium]
MNEEIRALLDKVTNLPSPPAVAAQVIDLAKQPDVHLAQVAAAISCDASLAAKVMRVSNSAMYARRRKSTNLRQALVVLGLHATVTLALGFSLMPLLQRSKGQHEMFEHTWRRSLMAGICARTVADVTRRMNAEEAFLSALLQDVGIMGIDRIKPSFYEPAVDIFRDHGALIEFEREHLGADHAEVGAILLNTWNLPEYLQDAVSISHRFHGKPGREASQNLSAAVALSGPLADVWLATGGTGAEVRKVSRLYERELKVGQIDFNRIMKEIADTLPEMAHIFETDLIDTEEAQMITEHASEILTDRTLASQQQAARANEKVDKLQSYADNLEQATQRDELTKVASRSYLQQLLEKGFDNAVKFSWPLAIMFVDLDHFKQVNDTYGHAAGDEVLRNVGSVLANSLRDSDTAGRYGGEEFLVILPGTDEDGIPIVANRMLQALRDAEHAVSDTKKIRVTASIGCAMIGEGHQYSSLESFVARADEALYAAKDAGRDTFRLFDPPPRSPDAAKNVLGSGAVQDSPASV